MITMDTDRLIDDYLRRLEAAAAHLQRSRRAELVAEIREHIEAALREEDAANEVAVRNILERLGPPEEIVEATEPAPTEGSRDPGRLETVALVALVIPFVGWIVGIVLVLISRAWSRREKFIGMGLGLLPAILPFFWVVAQSGGRPASSSQVPAGPGGGGPLTDPGSGDSGAGIALAVLAIAIYFLAGVPSAVYLGWRLRRQR
jgi:HAAS domain-containing protein